ncbi:MAG: 2-carboxy-1,4-naphthoquinone phytyltransferase [Oscillatoriales cyanobacterium C42_A2020_001]|nr:2-carboxy-1,4-naphthoquinone phytyltransferase [Leptolyngbyaceae cyanobacterium C42_A2020_001]
MTLRTVERPVNKKLWLAAIKPPMYSVAIMPIWVGSAVAYAVSGTFHTVVFFTFLVSAILILAWENLSNDVFDSETGVDVNKSNSVVNLTGNKSLVFWISNGCLALGLLGIAAIAFWQQDFTVIGLILLCCAIGYVYQGPPFRLSYKGLGEILCFFAFGPIAFAAVSYSQTKSWLVESFAASIVIGIATSLILFCSHFNQVKDDAEVGKKTPIVRLGTQRAAQLLPWICGSVYGLTVVFVLLKLFPVWTLLVFVSLPYARKLCHCVWTQHHQPETLLYCRFIAVAFHFWSGLMLGLGFVVG